MLDCGKIWHRHNHSTMSPGSGRPISDFITTNFTRGEKVDNKSNWYYWKCNICGDKAGSKGAWIQGRDNNLPNHIAHGCPDASPDVRREARTFILDKTQVPESHRNGTSTAGASALDQIVSIGKRKKHSESLDGYIDYPPTDGQKSQANTRLLQYVICSLFISSLSDYCRWFIHANIPFLTVENPFFHQFLDIICPSYTAPSQYVLWHNLLDAECVCVQQEDIDQLKAHTKLTLLLDGWEDCLKWRLYGSVAVEVNHHPIILALEEMTGVRGSADNLLIVTWKAMDKMEIGDGKSIIAVTIDNPTIMQAYCQNFQKNFPWVLVSSYIMKINILLNYHRHFHASSICSLNILIGEIIAYSAIKKIIAQTTHIVSFFTMLHYWGGQLNAKAKQQGIKQHLKQNCESQFYALILYCLSVLTYKSSHFLKPWGYETDWDFISRRPLFQLCVWPGAQQQINEESPIASNIVEIILHQCEYWKHLERLVKTTKPLVDAIGNLESCQASLVDCILELIHCIEYMLQLSLDANDDVGFWQHAKAVFNCHFHVMNTNYHSLALFLHPLCQKLAIIQAASGQSIKFMIKVVLDCKTMELG